MTAKAVHKYHNPCSNRPPCTCRQAV